ncbi:MAG: hypothetical protein PCFJNLEI_00589 [Verrucomicrobiae bacterium]|nr:hypothetical protein [Verrucomicrobiae bacterium]
MKFRCLRCSQKIGVEDHAIGVVIVCPTCAERLIVPPRPDSEFVEEIPVTLVPPAPPAAPPNLARQLMTRLVEGLIFQRNHMLETQNAAAEQIAAMEQRVAVIQTKLQRRLAYYEERIETLEAENYLLQHRNKQLLKQVKQVPLGTPPRMARSRLTDEVLLGA